MTTALFVELMVNLERRKMSQKPEEPMVNLERKKMREKPPEVWVSLVELTMQDNSVPSFLPSKFVLKGLRAKCKVELAGTNAQIIQELGQDLALKIMEKVDIGKKLSLTKKGASELFGKLQARMDADEANSPSKPLSPSSTSLIEVKERAPIIDRLGSGKGEWDRGTQKKQFEVTASFNLSRELGDDQVEVTLHQIEMQKKNSKSKSILQSENLDKYIIEVLSQRATDVLAQKALATSGSSAPPPKLK